MARHHTIFIDGEAGTTGLQIRERLAGLAGFDFVTVSTADRKNAVIRQNAMQQADLVISCLPDDAAREAAALVRDLGSNAPKLLDASSAFRVASDWVYGFPELSPEQAAQIRAAPRVSNPGCYPTGAIALLRPLIRSGLLPADHPISINAVSGYSGGGRSMIAQHEAKGGPAFELYGLDLEHKHVPEIELFAGLDRRPIFVPSVGHFPQGMLVSIPLHLQDLSGQADADTLYGVLAQAYAGCDTISVHKGDIVRLDAAALQDSDMLRLHVIINQRQRHALLVAQLDNLGKGAAGAAVQNVKLMLGRDLH